jgi:glutamate N-acetyltransferase/amino-acid N-acetyltransferase
VTEVPLPRGFRAHSGNAGVKDTSDDVALLVSEVPCAAAAVFTRSRFEGPSVTISRRHVADGRLQACVVVSKNANVATGPPGAAHAAELAELTARVAGCTPDDVLVASTGVIGRQYPMDRLRAHFAAIDRCEGTDATRVARAMMTTDTRPKTAVAEVGGARIVGLAKGSGMIEPDMATMIALVVTDAAVEPAELDHMFRQIVERTFNSLSIDTDTSTSGTAAVLANGLAGPVAADELAGGLEAVCLDLTRQLAVDGEGATKLLVVEVTGAATGEQARRLGKLVVNSPLVKTAVHGADPNWGRVAMAVGKSHDETIDQDAVTITFGADEVYPRLPDDSRLQALECYMAGDEVRIGVDLGLGDCRWMVYGCDLGDGYVRINADYTT